jgi:hypothetical protein
VHKVEKTDLDEVTKIPAQNVVIPAQNVVIPAQNVVNSAQNVVMPTANVVNPTTDVVNKNDTESDNKSFVCEKCNRLFARAYTLKRHLSQCKGYDSLTCPDCHMVFTSRHTRHYHKKVCKGSPEESTASSSTTNNYNQCTINNNSNNNNINNNIQVNIQCFNHENLDYISHEFAKQCLDSGVFGVNPMLDKIYFDKEHPENCNVKLRSLKNSLVEVFKDHQWVPQGLCVTIDRMITNAALAIMKSVSHPDIDFTNHEIISNINSIQNIKPEHKKRIREDTKSKLVARRDLDDSDKST